MSLARIEALLRPPEDPSLVAGVDRAFLRILLQSELPADYVRFLDRYGGGEIPGLLRVLDPDGVASDAHPIRQLLLQLNAMNHTRLVVGWKWGTGKGTGDFLPWGIADNGVVLYYRSVGPAARWTVALGAPGVAPQHFRQIPLTMTAFLGALLADDVEAPELPARPTTLSWVASPRVVAPIDGPATKQTAAKKKKKKKKKKTAPTKKRAAKKRAAPK
ncbi:MAG: hypothetical protein H0T46_01070 [Deltaproteobacteria bacterium]|nr:hypothetical protein [Deltaproteobacteria bacterium]